MKIVTRAEVVVSHGQPGSHIQNLVYIDARGGTRRERGAAIGAAVRGEGWTLLSMGYSETAGFLTMSSATYKKW